MICGAISGLTIGRVQFKERTNSRRPIYMVCETCIWVITTANLVSQVMAFVNLQTHRSVAARHGFFFAISPQMPESSMKMLGG